MRVSLIPALALVGLLAGCETPQGSMGHTDSVIGHFGAGMTVDRTAGR